MQPIFIKEFLPSQILNLCHSYLLIKYSNKTEFKIDAQTNSLVSEYADFLMETLMQASQPVIEQNVGKNFGLHTHTLEFMIRVMI